MDGGRSDGGGDAELELEDEFACAGTLRGSLTSLHGAVERIFRVTFAIGADDAPHGSDGQIWLKLRGPRADVKAAKLFVRGVVNQEEQKELSYPSVLHSVFCGARGLFMDCLIKCTSALIVVGSPGFLLISGLAEPVVRAYSLITDLVERYEGTQSRRSEPGDRSSGESLDSRRAFKTLVEKLEDRHILDLLVLPGSVKEILLDLVRESGLGSSPDLGRTCRNGRLHDDLEDTWDKPFAITYAQPQASGRKAADKDSLHSYPRPPGAEGRAEGAGEQLPHSPLEVAEEEEAEQRPTLSTEDKDGPGDEDEHEVHLSKENKEFWLLLKFFTAMGYTEDVVKRVLALTGPKEASQILDLVQQEQDRSDHEQRGAAPKPGEKNRPCETEHREDEEAAESGCVGGGSNGEVKEAPEAGGGGVTGRTRHSESVENNESEEDFVLGVLKKAAATCGYTEQKVAEVYSMLPDRSTHQLLLELQRERGRDAGALEGPREMDDVIAQASREERAEDKEARGSDDEGWADALKPHPRTSKAQRLPVGPHAPQPQRHQPPHSPAPPLIFLPQVKGPPLPTYPSPLTPPLSSSPTGSHYEPSAPTSRQNHPAHDPRPKPAAATETAARARDKRGLVSTHSVVVTGQQRFLEGLQMPFDLQLTDKPGDPKLRTIIIDGSNVAMSHGLGHFFSCRGIALAVQHFWDRGHRNISALLPQWRQKSDPKIKEQHYLSKLQKLGLLSYTPSREVQGKRISSYDDRFMLQLAQKTDGVIVTNDNLRDLSDESQVWRDIIKKRLLQYTFVGDHFMVPDDPLGRGGPHLDDFLCSEHRTPDPGNHSFAGLASPFHPSKFPRSQTEVLNYRDRTLGGAVDASGGGNRRGRGRDKGHQHRQHEGGGADRSPEETASLREQLCQVFPDQDNMVILVLQCHPAETDVNVLSGLILEHQNN
ncbi:protein KHNYN [Betta splendens]|uniref:Protein KHNYN n=1 Tax=Betta splendens TaxID=158456 RepID=A0A6P7LGL7_BETSP|nr:protein KHNYN [Betta splendens]